MSISGSKRIKFKVKGKPRFSSTGMAIVGQGEIFLANHRKPMPRWFAWCSRSPYTGSWKKLKMSLISSGPTKWGETPPSVIKVSTASIIKTGGIQPRTVEPNATIWSSKSRQGS